MRTQMPILTTVAILFCCTSAFAGPMVGGGPAPVEAIISCARGDDAAFHIYSPGRTAFYANYPVHMKLTCSGDNPIVCGGTGNDGVDREVEVAADDQGELTAKVFSDSSTPDDLLVCRRLRN